jgi:hypothetical protein
MLGFWFAAWLKPFPVTASPQYPNTPMSNPVTHLCDRCGQPMEKGQLRYTVKIQVFAAYDELEISGKDLLKDHRKEIERLIEQTRNLTEEELMREVYVEMQFDLCRACQGEYLKQPIPQPASET